MKYYSNFRTYEVQFDIALFIVMRYNFTPQPPLPRGAFPVPPLIRGARGVKTPVPHYNEKRCISQYLGSNYIPTTNIAISRFISVLHPGTISTHPFSVTVELGSHFPLTGGMAKFWMFIPFYLAKQGQLGTMRPKIDRKQGQLRKTLLDLLSHLSDRLYLYHSDLAVNGTEQTGPLLSLIYAPIFDKHPHLAIPP